MLTRRVPAAAAVVMALLAVATVGVVVTLGALRGGPAYADGSGSCPPEIPWCTVVGGAPGTGGGGGSGGSPGGSTGCAYHGQPVACYDPVLGYYHNSDACYYWRLNPQPAPGDPVWVGHTPGTGAFYRVTCTDGPPPWGSGSETASQVWVPIPATGPTPEQLALDALSRIRLDGPAIHMAPSSTGVGGLVGLPVWMWTTVGAHTWGPISSSASSGALTVDITAHADRIVWDMGDGHVVVCHNPGVAYRGSDGASASPECGYTYLKPSTHQRGGRYTITATTTWTVNWDGGGESGVITVTRVSRSTVRINEQQVVVR